MKGKICYTIDIKRFIVLGEYGKTKLIVAPCDNNGQYQDNLKTIKKIKELFFDINELKKELLIQEQKRNSLRIDYINGLK